MAQTTKVTPVIEISPEVTIDQGFVKLPIHHEALRGFVSSLLGRPQTVEQLFKNPFTLEINNILNLYHSLEQRVRQNPAQQLDFKTIITYEDDSSVTLGSIEELRTYNGIRPLVITRLNLYWSYLIHFADKESPEKQEIEIVFVSDYIIPKERPNNFLTFKNVGKIQYIIRYTDRTWGSDIQNLLSNQIKPLLEEENKFYAFLRKYQSPITFLCSIFLFVIILIGCISTANRYSVYSIKKIKNIIGSSSDLHVKLDKISEYIASGDWLQFNLIVTVILIAGVFLSIMAGILFDSILDKVSLNESFICLNDQTKKFKEKSRRSSRNNVIKFITSFLISVSCGVIGNYIFQMLTTK
ncbi:hypothetical protein [Paenibacillus gorillae]|uniref:hypothetical protein n=1 Tax=Paenibacillus gorillae TaxID=1243662 RepID=UPI0004B6CFC1|nr:hypothetical protein [Paenibacillus gorillae]